jgi:Rad3-related DNA helicase
VVNHALTLQNAVSESTVLPQYDYIIFDEAHHLERVTTDSLTINLSLTSYLKPYERLQKVFSNLEQTKLLQNVSMKNGQIIAKTEIFFGLLGIFIEKNAAPDAYQSQYLIKEDALNSLEWNKVKESAQIINDLNNQLLNELEILTDSPEIKDKNALREFKNAAFEIEKRKENMQTVFLTDQWQNRINWTYKTYEGLGCLKSAPLQIGEIMEDLFYSEKKGIILTSATLRTDKSFYYLRKSLSLDERFEEIALPSHFDYPEQVKILIPKDLPKPATEGYFKSCAQMIHDIVIKNGGRTMVLFTAKKTLTATYMEIAPKLKEKGFEVLAQGMSGGKGKILEHFKEESENTVLFGTDSFWEGVDIPGDMLTCIVIQKLPFDPPSDPIIFSRGQHYTDNFNDYQLPRAILKFKQGFGRLIRTHKDKGSMVVLDSRIVQNSYGHQFLESLPEGIKVEYGTAEKIAGML